MKTPKPKLTAQIHLRHMLNAFLAMGHSREQWDRYFSRLKQLGAIDKVWRDGKEIVCLWTVKPICPLHRDYKGEHRPTSRAKGCNCRLVWEANQ